MKITRFWGSILAASSLLGVSVWAAAQNAAAPSGPSGQNPRIALVIGEESYPDQTLATSANDAGLVAQVLQAAGFDVVGARDLDEKSIRTALRDFLARASAAGPNMQAFVYLAGRAVQFEGDNFFVPVDAQIAHGADVPIEAVRLADFTHALASVPGLARIVVLDGARANPFAKAGEPLAGGLALVDPDAGELVAFDASPGSIAGDEKGPYGIYAKALAGSMRQGGVAIEDIFGQTRLAVNQASGGAQLPWSASKLTAPYFVFERAADAPPATPAAFAELSHRPIKSFSKDDAYAAAVQRDTLGGYQEFLAAYPDSAQARRVRAILAGRREALFWRRSLEENSPHAYWTYLKRYPQGPHAREADDRLSRLAARDEPPAGFEPEDYSDLPPPPRDELVYADRPVYTFDDPDYGPPPPRSRYRFADDDDDWRDLPPPPPPTMFGVLPALAVAVPLLLTARAYHDAGRRDGHAEHGAPPLRTVPAAPPPLPPGIHVVQAPPAKIQKPLPTPAPSTTATPAPLAKTTPQPTPLPTPSPTPAPKGASPTPAPLAKTPQPIPLPTPTPSATLKPAPKSEAAPAPLAKTPPLPTPTPNATAKPEHKSDGAPPKAAPLVKTTLPAPLPTPALEVAPKPEHKGVKRDLAPAPLSKAAPTDPAVASKPAPVVAIPAPAAPIVHTPPVAPSAPPVAANPAPIVHSPPPAATNPPPAPTAVRTPPPDPAPAVTPTCGKPPMPACPK